MVTWAKRDKQTEPNILLFNSDFFVCFPLWLDPDVISSPVLSLSSERFTQLLLPGSRTDMKTLPMVQQRKYPKWGSTFCIYMFAFVNMCRSPKKAQDHEGARSHNLWPHALPARFVTEILWAQTTKFPNPHLWSVLRNEQARNVSIVIEFHWICKNSSFSQEAKLHWVFKSFQAFGLKFDQKSYTEYLKKRQRIFEKCRTRCMSESGLDLQKR